MYKKLFFGFFTKCEKFTHWLQINHDRDNFWAAAMLVKFSLFFWLCLILAGATTFSEKHQPLPITFFVIMFFTICFLNSMIDIRFIMIFKKLTYDSLEKNGRNPTEPLLYQEVHKKALVRISFTAAILYMFGNITLIPMLLIILLGAVCEFFTAVTPLHPNDVEKKRIEQIAALPITN